MRKVCVCPPPDFEKAVAAELKDLKKAREEDDGKKGSTSKEDEGSKDKGSKSKEDEGRKDKGSTSNKNVLIR